MIIAGAGGHAKEILGIFSECNHGTEIFFYDDVSIDIPDNLFDRFIVLRSEKQARAVLQNDPRFVLGVGNPFARQKLANKFIAWGGQLTSIISPFARIGNHRVMLGDGINVMTGAVITQDIAIGTGSLVHVQSSIHHDSIIGEFCELLPGCHILGNVIVGDHVSIGSGAIVLPKIKIGNNVVIGAGAVVTKNIPDGSKVKGVPAR